MNHDWTNKSVLALARDSDPIALLTEKARKLVLEAMAQGWSGPPFDPFELAGLLNIPLAARDDLPDARTVSAKGRPLIEYNPRRPPARVRFSIAHEIAHTLFPDVGEIDRYRSHSYEAPADNWQLELLCNIAASEFLMPAGSLPGLENESPSIDLILVLKRRYAVSTEAVLRRLARISRYKVLSFAASRIEPNQLNSRFRLEYTTPSRNWSPSHSPVRIPARTILVNCSAIDYTVKAAENWGLGKSTQLEAVGIPPYPNHRFPRVAGLIIESATLTQGREISYLIGDATAPIGQGPRLLVHLVNDRTPNWGGPFAKALKSRFPEAQSEFKKWANKHGLALGSVHISSEMDQALRIATIVAQKGYGPSRAPRLQYSSLLTGLRAVREKAARLGASVHMPKIGSGEAKGSWTVIQDLIDETLTSQDVDVFVYSLPNRSTSQAPEQAALFVG